MDSSNNKAIGAVPKESLTSTELPCTQVFKRISPKMARRAYPQK